MRLGFRDFFRVLVARARLAFGVDIARFGKRDFREERTNEFVDKHGKEGNLRDNRALCAKLARFHCHAERNARLGKQGNAEVFDDIVVALGEFCAQIRARIFSCRTACDIHNANEYDHDIGEHREFKLRTAKHEKEYEQGRGPAVHPFHKLLGEIANIAKYRAEHHAGE